MNFWTRLCSDLKVKATSSVQYFTSISLNLFFETFLICGQNALEEQKDILENKLVWTTCGWIYQIYRIYRIYFKDWAECSRESWRMEFSWSCVLLMFWELHFFLWSQSVFLCVRISHCAFSPINSWTRHATNSQLKADELRGMSVFNYSENFVFKSSIFFFAGL